MYDSTVGICLSPSSLAMTVLPESPTRVAAIELLELPKAIPIAVFSGDWFSALILICRVEI